MGGCCQQRVSLCAGLGTVLGSLREDFGVCARARGSLGRSLCVASESGRWQPDACCVCVRVLFSAMATRSWGGAVLECPREGISSFLGSVKKRG